MSLSTYTGLVLFGASWCFACEAAKSQLVGLEHHYVNVDEEPELAIEYGIVGVPQLLGLRDGEERARASHVSRSTALEMGRNL